MSQDDPIQRTINRMTDKITDAMIHAVLALLVMLIRPVATLTEIFFRKDMGERYFTSWNAIAGYWILAFASIPLGMPWPGRGGYDELGIYRTATSSTSKEAWLFIAFAWSAALTVCTFLQYQSVKKRYVEGGRWHSRNVGVPRYPSLSIYIEKALPIVAGVAIMWWFQIYGFGLLLIVSGVVSILLRLYEAHMFRERVMDVIDGQIEQEYLGKAVMERSKPGEVDGLQAPLPAYVSQKFRQKFIEAVGAKPTLPEAQSKAA
jgi:uncharacterized protein YqgC (DUF456 family)